MNGDNFAPNDESAGELNKSQIVRGFLLKTHQEFAKAVNPGMAYLNDPSAGLEIRVALYLRFFLTSRLDMGNISAFFDSLIGAGISGIEAKVLRAFRCWSRAKYHDAVKGFLQQLDVMCVCTRNDYGERYSLTFGQYAVFYAIFFPCQSD